MNTVTFQYINLEYLDMMTEGDSDMKKEILGIVLQELRDDIPRMLDFFKAGDLKNANEISHKFKATLAFVGNDLMSDANKEAELITKMGGDESKLPGLFKIVEDMNPKVIHELEQHYNSL